MTGLTQQTSSMKIIQHSKQISETVIEKYESGWIEKIYKAQYIGHSGHSSKPVREAIELLWRRWMSYKLHQLKRERLCLQLSLGFYSGKACWESGKKNCWRKITSRLHCLPEIHERATPWPRRRTFLGLVSAFRQDAMHGGQWAGTTMQGQGSATFTIQKDIFASSPYK